MLGWECGSPLRGSVHTGWKRAGLVLGEVRAGGEAGAHPEAPSVGVVFKVSSWPWMWPLPSIAGGWGMRDGCGLVSMVL